MRRHVHIMCSASVAALCLSLIPGCSSTPSAIPGAVAPAPATYAAKFNAAKETLIRHGFELDRIDARAGIITTMPKAAAGLATPWIDHDTTLASATRSTIQPDRKRAMVTFSNQQSQAPDFTVTVQRLRLQRLGQRLDPSSVRLASRWNDPATPIRTRLFVVGDDPELAARLDADIAQFSTNN